MSELKKYYNKIKSSPEYLRDLTSQGAIEIDNFRLETNIGFKDVQEFANILEEYQLKDTAKSLNSFPYVALWRGMKKNSDKNLVSISELALEINLLKLELKNLPSNTNKLKELCSSLINISREFSKEFHGHMDIGMKSLTA